MKKTFIRTKTKNYVKFILTSITILSTIFFTSVSITKTVVANSIYDTSVSDVEQEFDNIMSSNIIEIVGTDAIILDLNLVYEENEVINLNLDINLPYIKGLDNTDLSNKINDMFIEYAVETYLDFITKAKDYYSFYINNFDTDENIFQFNETLSLTFDVPVNNGEVLVISHILYSSEGSSTKTSIYTTIDIQAEELISLQNLFTDNSYIDIISSYICDQIFESNKLGEDIYFLTATTIDELKDIITRANNNQLRDDEIPYSESYYPTISPDHNFFINDEGKLVISFQPSTIAPNYQEEQLFVIPTDLIKDILVNDQLIK